MEREGEGGRGREREGEGGRGREREGEGRREGGRGREREGEEGGYQELYSFITHTCLPALGTNQD